LLAIGGAKTNLPKFNGIDGFIALSDADKELVYKDSARHFKLSETRPLNAKERETWERFRSKALANRKARGRPVIGNGAKQVAITVERDLLKRSDAFAKRNNLKRSELFAAGVNALMENPKLLKRKGAA
jgi:hypothetical protein